MKAGLLTIAALAASTSAQVHRGHRHLHQHKRDEVFTHVEYVTATAPHAVVYVDSNGKPVSTKYDGQAVQPAQTPAAYNPPKQEQPKSSPKPKETPKYNAPAAPKPSKPSTPPTYGDEGSSGIGIVYSPYKVGGCKSADEVKADFEDFSGYGLVRIYGTDCEQVQNVIAAAKPKNMKIFAGIFNIDQVQSEADIIIKAAKNDWAMIDTISVGNELVNAGAKSPGDVVNAINTARGIFKAAGYTGNIVTVDTFVAMIAHPELCQASDYAATNCHSFFDGGKTAEQTGDFVKEQAERVSQACGGKKTVITESGWPWKGATNGAAVPSKENQKIAMDSLKSKFTKDIILFTAFDDLWKTNTDATHGAEQYWGYIKQSG